MITRSSAAKSAERNVQLVTQFTVNSEWDPSEQTPEECWDLISKLPLDFLIANPHYHSMVLNYMVKSGFVVEQFELLAGKNALLFSGKVIVPFGLVCTCVDRIEWVVGWTGAGCEYDQVNNSIERLEYFLDLAPEAVESADPSTGELIIQLLHRIASDYVWGDSATDSCRYDVFKLLIEAGMRPGSSLTDDRAGLYRLTEDAPRDNSLPVKSILLDGGNNPIGFLTWYDPPILTAADIYDLELVSFVVESYFCGKLNATWYYGCLLGVIDSLLKIEPRAVTSVILILPEHAMSLDREEPDVRKASLDGIVNIFVEAGLRVGLFLVSHLIKAYIDGDLKVDWAWKWECESFLEVIDSLLELEPRAVKSAIQMLPDFTKALRVDDDELPVQKHHLGGLMKIFVDAGLRIGLGGEYGIGGLFLPSETSEHDFRIEDIDLGGHEDFVLRKLADSLPGLHESPILHVAMRGK
jgi:hypothetical protein